MCHVQSSGGLSPAERSVLGSVPAFPQGFPPLKPEDVYILSSKEIEALAVSCPLATQIIYWDAVILLI